MKPRITEKNLQDRIDWLNKLTGNPIEPYQGSENQYQTNVGNYHLDCAYGGVGLAQMVEGGGVTKIIGGFHPKREFLTLLNAYISGIEDAKKGKSV